MPGLDGGVTELKGGGAYGGRMSQPPNRKAAAIERREDARRRVGPITASALAGGVMVTAIGSGLAWLTAPGRSGTSTSAAPTSSSTAPSSSSVSPSSSSATGGLQPSDQPPLPSDGGDGLAQAVTGGS